MSKKKPLSRKSKSGKNADGADGMWINPNSSFRAARGDRAWENRPGGIPNSARLLELADLALGLKKSEKKIKHLQAASTCPKRLSRIQAKVTTPIKTDSRECPICYGAGFKGGQRCLVC